jgi:hypothetical protein
MSASGIITPARKTLRFEKVATHLKSSTTTTTTRERTPLREKTSNNDDFDNETEALLRHELAHARAEIALLREEKAKLTMGSRANDDTTKKKNNENNENETISMKSSSPKVLLLPSPPTLETPMRFRRERDSFRKELKLLSRNAEETETKMLAQNEKTRQLSQENEAWLLKALNEKTRALKIAAKANNASEKELAQTKESASLLEKEVREQTEKVQVLKQRLVKNENARKKLETKVERYREALKDANLRNTTNNNGGNEEAAMPQESVDTAMSNESYCGENKVALHDDENNIIHNNNNNRVKVEEEKEKEKDDDEEEVNFRVFPEQMVDTNDPLLGGIPATPAMFQFPSAKMHKNVGNNEYETIATDMTTTPGGEVVEFYGRPRRDTRKDVFVILSVWMMTIAALVSMGKSSSLSSQVVAGHRVVVKGFGFFC